jgi:hypothetical protein
MAQGGNPRDGKGSFVDREKRVVGRGNWKEEGGRMGFRMLL